MSHTTVLSERGESARDWCEARAAGTVAAPLKAIIAIMIGVPAIVTIAIVALLG